MDRFAALVVTVLVFSVYVSSNQAAGHRQSRARHRGHGNSDAARCYDIMTSTLVNTNVEIINQLLRLLLPGLQGTQSARMIRTILCPRPRHLSGSIFCIHGKV